MISYIDGFNLYYGLKASRWRKYYWLDVRKLSERLLNSGQHLAAVKYFTSRVTSPKDKADRQSDFLDAISATGVTIVEGHFLEKEDWCRSCGRRYIRHEEKMTDVNIATQLLIDAFANRFDLAIIVSGDSDLVPPVRAVRWAFPQKRIGVAFPPNRYSADLHSASSFKLQINERHLRQSQLPNPVVSGSGVELWRPSRWS